MVKIKNGITGLAWDKIHFIFINNSFNVLSENNETLENYLSIYDEYKKAYETRKAIIDNLYHEIKICDKIQLL